MNKIYAVGIGPGAFEEMTLRAIKILESVELIVGYKVYVELVRPHFADKEFYSTAMRGEAERCRYAIEQARAGRDVAVVCSGDAGIYGMAGLLYELRGEAPLPEIHVVPGLTAACSGAALLGAPLTHDFAVISLSDLLTPWQDIEMRIDSAVRSGLSVVLYNPSSMKRHDYLSCACDIALRHLDASCVCGVAQNIGRAGERMQVMTLGQLKGFEADMFTTVFIGNARTRQIGERMVTPRGYHDV